MGKMKALAFAIRSIPALMVFRDGIMLFEQAGAGARAAAAAVLDGGGRLTSSPQAAPVRLPGVRAPDHVDHPFRAMPITDSGQADHLLSGVEETGTGL
jgi:hypothetical protein